MKLDNYQVEGDIFAHPSLNLFQNPKYDLARSSVLPKARALSKSMFEEKGSLALTYLNVDLLCGVRVAVIWYFGEAWVNIKKRLEAEGLVATCTNIIYKMIHSHEEESMQTLGIPWLRAIKNMPEVLQHNYTMGGRIPIVENVTIAPPSPPFSFLATSM